MVTWASQYIGVPFVLYGRTPEGWDCYGLIRWVLRSHFGVTVPMFSTGYSVQTKSMATIIASNKDVNFWTPVTDPRIGDCILMSIAGLPIHVGIICSKDKMLHVMKGIDTSIEDYTSLRWRSRIEGFYRHKDLLI